MGFKLSIGLGLALAVTAAAFKLYYDKSQAELESFHIQLERALQNEKILEGTVQQQNENLKQTVEKHTLMLAKVETLTEESVGESPSIIKFTTEPSFCTIPGPKVISSSSSPDVGFTPEPTSS